jgi:hypothetical protein
MGNIRIKDIATTAASTASDDFIAIDGATNGTRKLDIYNPTIGGNLGIGTAPTWGSYTPVVQWPSGGIGSYLAGNELTIAQNAYYSFGWKYSTNNAAGRIGITSGNFYFYSAGSGSINSTISFTTQMLLNASGNLLLGTTTDSSNGKLQLATHTTSAGGIGFGTDTNLYRVNTSVLAIDSIGGGSVTQLDLKNGGSRYGYLQMSTSGISFYSSGARSLVFGSNDTVALTLDSSQNATFAGVLKAPAGSSTSPSHTFSGDTSSGIYSLGTKKLGIAVNANIAVAVQADVDGSTGPTVYVKDLATAPTVNPSGGGYLFSQGGALKWRGSSGTVTTIANA